MYINIFKSKSVSCARFQIKSLLIYPLHLIWWHFVFRQMQWKVIRRKLKSERSYVQFQFVMFANLAWTMVCDEIRSKISRQVALKFLSNAHILYHNHFGWKNAFSMYARTAPCRKFSNELWITFSHSMEMCSHCWISKQISLHAKRKYHDNGL